METAPVDGPYLVDHNAPFGRRLDVQAIADRARNSPVPGLVVIDYGDLWRAKAEAEACGWTESANRQSGLEQLAELLRSLGDDVRRDLVIVASLTSDPDSLAPVVVADPESTAVSVSSGTTRQPGLIASIDLAPTVLSRFGILVPPDMIGRPIKGLPSGPTTDQLAGWLQAVTAVHRARAPIVRGYIWLSLAALVGLGTAAFWPPIRPVARWLMVAMMAGPSAMMLMPTPGAIIPAAMAYAAGTAVLTVFSVAVSARRGWSRGPLLLCLVAAATIAVDQLSGARVALGSVLGYSPIAGARYYGLGNELAGVLLGSSIMGASLVPSRSARRTSLATSVLGLLATCLIVANPALGANLGATISLAAAWLAFAAGGARRRGLAAAAAIGGGLVAAGLAVGLDTMRSPSEQSHLGRLAVRVLFEGFPALGAVAARKIDLNLRLMRYTVWSRALMAAVVALFVLSRWPIGAYRQMVGKRPLLATGVQAATLGAAVALVVNDSGIVTAAAAMIYVAGVTGYALLTPPQAGT